MTVTRYRISTYKLRLRVKLSISVFLAGFCFPFNGNVAAFDIFIPRLTEDPFEISFMRAGVSGIVAGLTTATSR